MVCPADSTASGTGASCNNATRLYRALAELQARLQGRCAFELHLQTEIILGILPTELLLERGWSGSQTRLDRLFKGPRQPRGALDFLFTEAVLFSSHML